MKKLLALLLCIACLCLVFVSCKKQDDTPEGMKNAAVEGVEYALYVPTEWTLYGGGVSGAYAFGENAPGVIVTTYLSETACSAADYWNEVCVPSYQETLKDFSLLEEKCEDTTMGGLDAKQYVFTYVLDETSFESLQVLTVRKNRIYALTYTALSTDFEKYTDTVKDIVSQFKFTR